MHKDSKKTWLGHLGPTLRRDGWPGFFLRTPLPARLFHANGLVVGGGVPIETIGLLSELTIAYKLKFVWRPFSTNMIPRCWPSSSAAVVAGSLFRRSQS
jgi:hypothetical protein